MEALTHQQTTNVIYTIINAPYLLFLCESCKMLYIRIPVFMGHKFVVVLQ